MELTRNEKKTLKLLIDNLRVSDSEIASKLNISSQAVGKIRHKLEGSLVESYSLNLNFAKLGIQTFALSLAKLTDAGLQKGQVEIEQLLVGIPHIINLFRISKGSSSHIILYGFRDIEELEDFFHSAKIKEQVHKYMEPQDVLTFSNSSILKNSSAQLFHKRIDSVGSREPGVKF